MQQPDYRDQSEPEVKGQTEENSQSDSQETQEQDDSQLEQREKETDDVLVSRSKSQPFTSWQTQTQTLETEAKVFSLCLVHTQ